MTPKSASALHADLVARGVIKPQAEPTSPANDDAFDGIADAWASVSFCYDVIKRRMSAGGPGWEPKL